MGNTLGRKLHIGNLRKIWSITWTACCHVTNSSATSATKRPLKNDDRTENTTRPSFPAARFLGGWIIWIGCLLWQGNAGGEVEVCCSFFQLQKNQAFLSPCLDYKLNSIKPGWIITCSMRAKKLKSYFKYLHPPCIAVKRHFTNVKVLFIAIIQRKSPKGTVLQFPPFPASGARPPHSLVNVDQILEVDE